MNAQNIDEIDLKDLAIDAIRFFQRNLKFILACTIIGASLSGAGYFLLPKAYQARLILGSNILTDTYGKEIAESLRGLIKEKSYTDLAFHLGIDKEIANKLRSLEIEGKSISLKTEGRSVLVKKIELGENEQQDYTIFTITVKVTDKTQLSSLQAGLVQFFRNNEFVKLRARQRTGMYQKLVDKIGLEINSLDSLKKQLFEGKSVHSKNAEMFLVDPSTIYWEIIELTKEQLKYKNALELADGIQVVENFIPYEKPLLKPSILLAIGIMGGFIFALAFLSFAALLKAANTPAE